MGLPTIGTVAPRTPAKKAPKIPATPPRSQVEDLPVMSFFRQIAKVQQVNTILAEHDNGDFSRSAILFDEILTDDRISGVFEQRSAGLQASPMVVEPSKPKRKQRKLAEIVGGSDGSTGKWSGMVGPDALDGLLTWGLAIGVGVAQIIWQKTPEEWMPTLRTWHPQFVRWDHEQRAFLLRHSKGELVLPRPDEQPHGDGQWVVFCPYGVQYGWRRALVRSLAHKYISRQWSERDWDRHNERQGMAILKAMIPAGASPTDKLTFFRRLANVGSEGVVACVQGAQGVPGWNVEALEFTAQTFAAMEKRKTGIDVDVAVRVLGQNLSTEVTQGLRAAAQTHNLIRLDKAVKDSDIGPALGSQLLWWWALWNHGDGDLAPTPKYYVSKPQDDVGEAQALKTLGEAVGALQTVEPRVDATSILEEWGVPLISESEMAALEQAAAEEQAAAAGAGADDDAAAGETPAATAAVSVELSDGSTIEVEGSPSPEELAEIVAQAEAELAG